MMTTEESTSITQIGNSEIVRQDGDYATKATMEDPDLSDVNDKDEARMCGGCCSASLRPFVVLSAAYLAFTVTDGALRTITLLHAYNMSFSALEVAMMFSLYELAGAFTNLAAGLAGARWGLKPVVIIGLLFQILTYGMLYGWDSSWEKRTAIIYVTIAQMFGGIAKDLTKLGGKTVTKLVTPEDKSTRLFKLVSLITGMKNSLKGVGYFLGSALLTWSYGAALGIMIGIIVLFALPVTVFGLEGNLGMAKSKNATWSDVFVLDNSRLNWLSLARLFLFASRDFWFEVPLPFYLRSPACGGLGEDFVCEEDVDCTHGAICDAVGGVCANLNAGGGCGGLGLSRVLVGTFLAAYIILYGQVQSWTPQLVTGPLGQTPPNKFTEVLWGMINCIPTLVMAIVMYVSPTFLDESRGGMAGWLISSIVIFAVIFAINSSIHSYLVVKYAASDRVAASVGFYYMSNALGRLFGTIGSGFIYTYVGENFGEYAGANGTAGMAMCFAAGTISSVVAALITTKIDDKEGGLRCGPLICAGSSGKGDEEVDGGDGEGKAGDDEQKDAGGEGVDSRK